MKSMKPMWALMGSLAVALPLTAHAADPGAECRSSAGTVKAIRLQDFQPITTRFQFDNPNLQKLMGTTVLVTGAGLSCIVAHFSAHARITDNYIVFQVRVDGVPMEGHLSGLPLYPTPVVVTQMEDYEEQLFDPTRMVAYNFFKQVRPGVHTVEVMVAAGSNIVPNSIPSVGSPVLTLQYR
jgi:hypothetical protein